MSQKKTNYLNADVELEESTPAVKKKSKKKQNKTLNTVKHVLGVIGTTFLSLFMIVIITCCIVAVTLTVYIMQFADSAFDVDLKNVDLSYTSFIYAKNSAGEQVEIKRLSGDENRIWVNMEQIPKHTQDAFTAVEDKRFYEHQGVDWKRTVFSLGADVLNLSRAGEGGSTVTQQLIKNLTGDDEISWERKLREIFRALSLEKKYTKTDIMESYLNNIGWGGMNYGVGAASQYYFGKEAKDLDIAEAAILASMIKNPSKRSPYIDLENCKVHQIDTLYYMYEQGYINTSEYEAAEKEQVKFAYVVYGDDFGYTDPRSLTSSTPEDPDDEPDETTRTAYRWNEYEISQDWYVDAALDQVYEDYAELKGISYTSAKKEISNGGYKIYINEDMALQKILEEKYKDPLIAQYSYDPDTEDEKLVQSAFVIMDYSGTVRALVGGLGDKPGDNCWNRATMSVRAPGSTMKPISAYSMGIETNQITYSSMIPDKGVMLPGATDLWPTNVEGYTTGTLFPAWKAVQASTNTVAVRVARLVTVPVLFNQLQSNLEISTLVPGDDEQLSPIPLGALTDGVKLVELAAAYQMFGNGGVYYSPKMYSKVLDNKDKVILEQNFYGNQAISSDTAWVTNRMLRTVVQGTSSAAHANLTNVEVIGKTGTSNDDKNLMFVGLTPNYVAVAWIGVDDGTELKAYNNKFPAQIWHDVMVDIEDTSTAQKFTPDSSVKELRYCVETGLLASSDCKDTNIGYYRQSNIPKFCSGDHEKEKEKILADWDAIDENGGVKPDVLPSEMPDTSEPEESE